MDYKLRADEAIVLIGKTLRLHIILVIEVTLDLWKTNHQKIIAMLFRQAMTILVFITTSAPAWVIRSITIMSGLIIHLMEPLEIRLTVPLLSLQLQTEALINKCVMLWLVRDLTPAL